MPSCAGACFWELQSDLISRTLQSQNRGLQPRAALALLSSVNPPWGVVQACCWSPRTLAAEFWRSAHCAGRGEHGAARSAALPVALKHKAAQ